MTLDEADRKNLSRLRRVLDRAGTGGVARLSRQDLEALPSLYRFGASALARLETQGDESLLVHQVRELVAQAHGILYRDLETAREPLPARLVAFFWGEVPRAIRAEWRVLAVAAGLLYGFALVAYVAVLGDLELAFSLLDPAMVASEIRQLEATAAGEPFRGNFTFGLGESPAVSGWLMAHNMGVGLLFFGAGLLPPLFLLLVAINGLMLGTYTAVAAHWGQAGAISSILWCHATIELQAILLAGAGGLVLVRGLFAPGPWTRGHALAREGQRALRLVAPVFPLLFVSGLIEGYVSPHAGFGVRLAVAVSTGVLLVAWVLLGGRAARTRRAA